MAILRTWAPGAAPRAAAVTATERDYTVGRRAFGARSGRRHFHLAPALAAGLLLWARAPQAGPPRDLSPDPLRYVSPSRSYRTTHTALDLEIDLVGQRIAGHVAHSIRSLRDGLEEIPLNCVGLVIDSVRVDGGRARFDYPVSAGRSTSWMAGAQEAVADDQLVIHLSAPLARDAGATVAIYYHGQPKIGLYWIQPEKGIPDKRHEVWSQGEGEDNRYWIPCNDYPNDKATFEGRFRVPRGFTAISNGTLVEKKEAGDHTEFYWKLDQPQVSYLIMLAVADYKTYETRWRDVPVMYVVPPGTDDATILRGYGLTPDMMEYMSTLIGIDYPYSKYAQVVVQDFIYGGMENTSATTMNMRTLYDERTELTRNEVNLVAHELAHQWWGDMVTCREWSHMWLNEGFATYYAYLYKEHREGDDAFRYQMRNAHNDVVNADNTEPRPMVVDFYNRTDARNNAHVYVKGASLLHMLRFLLGDRLYHETIRHYGEAHRFDVVETHDLTRAVKDVTGENLDWFFEQWAFLAGHPKFRVTKSWDRTASVLHLKVEQTQKTGGLVPVFRVPVDIEVTWDGGRRVHRVTIEQAEQDYYFHVPSEPTMVVFDKGDWILKALDFPKSASELVYELEHGDYMTRVRAAEALGGKGSDARSVPALRAALLADGHYGLRRDAALALGRIGNDAALTALVEGLSVADALVRLACVEAMGSFHGNEAAAARLERAFDDDRAYGVRAEAVNSLVKIRSPRAGEVCRRAIGDDSGRSMVRIAGLNGLAELKDVGSIDRVKKYALPGNAREHRHVAIAAYARLAREFEKDAQRRKASDALAAMVDDWHLRTREAVIDGLAVLSDPSATVVLRRVAANDALAAVRDRARRAADRIDAAEAARSQKTDAAAQIEDLERRVEALQKEIDETRRAVANPHHE
jgi:aminopeptidase N